MINAVEVLGDDIIALGSTFIQTTSGIINLTSGIGQLHADVASGTNPLLGNLTSGMVQTASGMVQTASGVVGLTSGMGQLHVDNVSQLAVLGSSIYVQQNLLHPDLTSVASVLGSSIYVQQSVLHPDLTSTAAVLGSSIYVQQSLLHPDLTSTAAVLQSSIYVQGSMLHPDLTSLGAVLGSSIYVQQSMLHPDLTSTVAVLQSSIYVQGSVLHPDFTSTVAALTSTVPVLTSSRYVQESILHPDNVSQIAVLTSSIYIQANVLHPDLTSLGAVLGSSLYIQGSVLHPDFTSTVAALTSTVPVLQSSLYVQQSILHPDNVSQVAILASSIYIQQSILHPDLTSLGAVLGSSQYVQQSMLYPSIVNLGSTMIQNTSGIVNLTSGTALLHTDLISTVHPDLYTIHTDVQSTLHPDLQNLAGEIGTLNTSGSLVGVIGQLGISGTLVGQIGSINNPNTLIAQLTQLLNTNILTGNYLNGIIWSGLTAEALQNENFVNWTNNTSPSNWTVTNVLQVLGGYGGATYACQLSSYQENNINQQQSDYAVVDNTGDNYFLPSYVVFGTPASGLIIDRSFMRWAFGNIQPAAVILSGATITMTAYNNPNDAAFTTYVKLINYNNCPALLGTGSAPYTWPTTSGVTWSMGTWTAGVAYTTPNITALLSGFVNLSGYIAGNYCGIRFDEGNSGNSQWKEAAPPFTLQFTYVNPSTQNAGSITQTFTNNILASTFTNFSCYVKYAVVANPNLGTNYLQIVVNYSDSTYDTFSNNAVTSSWAQVNIATLISNAGHSSKYVTSVQFLQQNSSTTAIPILISNIATTNSSQTQGMADYPFGIYTSGTTKTRTQIATDQFGNLTPPLPVSAVGSVTAASNATGLVVGLDTLGAHFMSLYAENGSYGSSLYIYVDGSLDNSTWRNYDTLTATASGYQSKGYNLGARYLRTRTSNTGVYTLFEMDAK
jgi:hypothetical protein